METCIIHFSSYNVIKLLKIQFNALLKVIPIQT